MKLNGSSILITGGANGIGQQIVRKLLENGCIVSVIDKDQNSLETLKKEYPEINIESADLTQFNETTDAINNIIFKAKKIHGVINNAGIIRNCPLVNMFSKDNKMQSVKLWNEIISTNLTSAFYVTTHIAEHMVSNRIKGVIINICSISANGNAGQTAYSASKAGLIGMSKTWAKELGPIGIRCVAISPGFIDTASTQSALSENIIEHITQSTPLRRLGTIEEIANAVLFAIENDFYTGKVLEIDGGLVF